MDPICLGIGMLIGLPIAYQILKNAGYIKSNDGDEDQE